MAHQKTKGRFHPSRISGIQKQMRVREWEKNREKKKVKPKMYSSVKELLKD